MLVFRYDKSFDGLLSALFDAYSMRAFPEALIGPGEPEPLFTERVHDVATDEAHAGRVWRGLERRLTARTRSMFVYAWHGEQPQGDLLMLRCLRRVFDDVFLFHGIDRRHNRRHRQRMAGVGQPAGKKVVVKIAGNRLANQHPASRKPPTGPISPPSRPSTTPCRWRWTISPTVSPTSGG